VGGIHARERRGDQNKIESSQNAGKLEAVYNIDGTMFTICVMCEQISEKWRFARRKSNFPSFFHGRFPIPSPFLPPTSHAHATAIPAFWKTVMLLCSSERPYFYVQGYSKPTFRCSGYVFALCRSVFLCFTVCHPVFFFSLFSLFFEFLLPNSLVPIRFVICFDGLIVLFIILMNE